MGKGGPAQGAERLYRGLQRVGSNPQRAWYHPVPARWLGLALSVQIHASRPSLNAGLRLFS